MAPTFLIVGATGNTGQALTQTLPTILKANKTFSDHRPTAQNLAKVPGVQQVVRAFIAPHNAPNQFTEESAFHVAALKAGVEYIVRISTTAPNVRPDFEAYYPRQHWAIEALLGSAEFSYIKQYRQTGEQGTLRLLTAKDAPVAPIHPDEVGIFAAHLLAQRDSIAHNRTKYIINGPEDITGEQLVGLVKQHLGTKVKDVSYQDSSLFDAVLASGFGGPGQSEDCRWVYQDAAPQRTPTEVLRGLLEE
ncbi:hypothetical protein BDW71DRAFT_201279 [Aspergillus fruticulosus]